MARYHEIAEDLRARIKRGDWKIGDKLPGISALQDEYKVERSLGTIRRAQQLLVADGMLRTEQGVGAFVIATEPKLRVDVGVVLSEIRDLANDGLGALLQARLEAEHGTKGKVIFELAGDDGRHFVLTTALQEYAARNHAEAQEAHDDGARNIHRQWAEAAEQMLAQIDAALS